ncbi:MAG: alpha/beta hydrolase [Cytophagales bacterium]|nr:alpha/beta hydrolase [Cytophagales bacterium]
MSRSSVTKATCEVFGASTQPSDELLEIFWQVLNYNEGKSIAYLIGRLIFDKEKYQERWISGMVKTKIPMCFINGPADPNSGLHMANRYKELIPNPKVYFLNDAIGHWPQIEDPGGIINAFFSFQADIKSNSF